MTRLVNVTCQDMAVNMRHVHDKVNWHMCQDTVTHMKHAHDKAGNCYTCQDVVVMYMGQVHGEPGYIALMYMRLETAIRVHMHTGCVMHMEHGQEKAGNCHRPVMGSCISGHAHDEAVCSTPGTVSIQVSHTLVRPPQSARPHPLTVRSAYNASVRSVDSIGSK